MLDNYGHPNADFLEKLSELVFYCNTEDEGVVLWYIGIQSACNLFAAILKKVFKKSTASKKHGREFW